MSLASSVAARWSLRQRSGVVWIGVVALAAAFGGAFAHLGVSPLYVGEIVLGLGLVALFASVLRRRASLPRSPVLWVLVAYMLWGLWQTVPYLPRYGADALRDAV